MISTAETLEKLKDFKDKRSEYFGIERIGLFGSTARGQQNKDSDVDVCVKLTKGSLFKLYGIQSELENILQCKVDVISLGALMRPLFKKSLENDAIYI
jgi:predicted nucleotidyltransferase